MELIAHRGEPDSFPENSLPGYRAVLEAGAIFLETDVQLTADGIPVLSHDASLLRLTGADLDITQTDYTDVRTLGAGYPDRFGAQYADFHIARLDEFVDLLGDWPQAHAFVEIKQQSIEAFGVSAAVDCVLAELEPVINQCILISFDADALVHAHVSHFLPLGWVIPEWNEANHAQADELQPDYLFCNRKRLPAPPAPLWQGAWQWVVYTVNDPLEIAQFAARGAAMLETNNIRTMLHARQYAADDD